MSTNSCEGFYGAKLVNRFALHSIKDDPFSHNISKTFGTNVMFFIQADFLVTFKQRCFKEDIIACEHGIEIQKPFVEVYYSDFSNMPLEHKLEMLYIVGRCLQLEKEGNKIEDLVKNTEAWKYFNMYSSSVIPTHLIAKEGFCFSYKKA